MQRYETEYFSYLGEPSLVHLPRNYYVTFRNRVHWNFQKFLRALNTLHRSDEEIISSSHLILSSSRLTSAKKKPQKKPGISSSQRISWSSRRTVLAALRTASGWAEWFYLFYLFICWEDQLFHLFYSLMIFPPHCPRRLAYSIRLR